MKLAKIRSVSFKTYLATVLLVALICIGATSYVLSQSSSQTITIEPASFTETASYIIFKVGDTIYAKNGTTGEIEYSGTDASTVIQQAINAILSLDGRGRIFIKSEIYDLSTTLTIEGKSPYPRLEIVGEGYGTSLRNYFNGPAIHLNNTELVCIRNLVIASWAPDYPSSKGIRITDSYRIELRDVWCYGQDVGFLIEGSCTVTMYGCQATDGNEGLVIYGAGDSIDVYGFRAFANSERGIRIDDLTNDAGTVRIINPNLENVGASQNIYIVNVEAGFIEIDGGVIWSSNKGIEITNPSTTDSQILISGVQIKYTAGHGISIYKHSNVTVSDCYIYINEGSSYGIRIEGKWNTISNCHIGGASAYSIYEVETSETDYNLITGVVAEDLIITNGANTQVHLCWNGTSWIP